MHTQQNIPQPPEHWIPGTIATALVATVLAVGVAIGEASMRDDADYVAPSFAPSTFSVSPATAEPWAVFVDKELPVAYARQPSGEWAFVRGQGASGSASSAE